MSKIVEQIVIPTWCNRVASGWCNKMNKKIVTIKCHDRAGTVLYSSACFALSETKFCGPVTTEEEHDGQI